MKRSVFSMVSLAFVTAFAVSSALKAKDIEDYLVGDLSQFRAPFGDFSSSDVMVRMQEEGEDSRLVRLSEKRGKVLLLTFWGEHSQLSRIHLRQLQDLQRHVGKDRLEVIAVNGSDKPFARVARALERLGFEDLTPAQSFGPQLLREMETETQFDYGRGSPLTWIIDTKGDVRVVSDTTLNWVQVPGAMALIDALTKGEV